MLKRLEILFVLIVLICVTNSYSVENEENRINVNHHKESKTNHHIHHKKIKEKTSNQEKKHNRFKVAIGHKQYVVNGNRSLTKTNSRNARVSNIPDNWERIPYVFQTYNEPDVDKYYLMPALSNGFLGTTAKNNSVYMNGLYTGYQGRSHRARLPSMTAIDAFISIESETSTKSFNFDCRKGAYITETRTTNAQISQRYFVHRRLRNIIVNEVRVELINRQPVTVELFNYTELDFVGYTTELNQFNNKYPLYILKNNYDNITFEQRVIKPPTYYKDKRLELNDGIYYLTARIPDPEVNGKQMKQVHIYYTNVPLRVHVYANTTVKYFHFVQSVDIESSRAQKAYEEAVRSIQQDPASLYVTHVSAWEEIWSRSGMAMLSEPTYTENNQEAFKLAQRLYSSFYNIYASVPMSFDNQFYGISPSGLAYGSIKAEYFNISTTINRQVSEGYGGHVFYSQEFWILPLLSMFNTEMSKSVIQSRLRRGYNTDSLNIFEKAREWAKNENLQGLRYAWEQGDYGDEVSPLQDAKNKIHTSACISFGLRNYLKTIQPREFLLQSISSEIPFKGEDYILEIAKYWFEKLQLDPLTNKFGIKDVSFGELPRSRFENNEAFTNYIAAKTMDTYKYALRLTDKNPYDTQFSYITRDFDDKIHRLKMPYDDLKQLYLEYDNYNNAQRNDETFVPFLNYPILKKLHYNQKKILYDTYGSQLPNDGKNMPAYASFLVGYMELNEEPKAKDYLGRMSNHFSGPFQVASEYPQTGGFLNTQNTFNYLPGYAAFAQAFIGGYSGIRIQDFQLDVIYPSEYFDRYTSSIVSSTANPIFKQPAPNVDSWNVTGVNYAGNKLDFIYNLKTKSLEIRNRRPVGGSSGEESLEIMIYEGSEITLKPLRIDEVVKINLATDTWKYGLKSKRLFRNNLYSENIHILASIYPTNKAKYLHKQSNSNRLEIKSYVLLFLIFIQIIFLTYL